MSALEDRYRRLLALLPWEHRRRYEEEMLGVLLDGAAEGQTRPRPAEVADLLAAAVRLRLGHGVRRLGDRAWADAFAAVGALTATAMAAVAVGRLTAVGRASLTWGAWPTVGTSDVGRAAVWALAATAALIGWRWAAAALAGAGAAVELVVFGYAYGFGSLPAAVGAAIGLAAAMALAVAAGRSSTFRLGWASALWALVAGAVVVAERLLRTAPSYSPADVYLLGRAVSVWTTVALAATLALAAAALLALAPAVRRRVVALLAGPLALLAVAWVDPYSVPYGGALQRMVALVVVPLAALVVGIVLVHRRDERARLLDLGRAADRSPAP